MKILKAPKKKNEAICAKEKRLKYQKPYQKHFKPKGSGSTSLKYWKGRTEGWSKKGRQSPQNSIPSINICQK